MTALTQRISYFTLTDAARLLAPLVKVIEPPRRSFLQKFIAFYDVLALKQVHLVRKHPLLEDLEEETASRGLYTYFEQRAFEFVSRLSKDIPLFAKDLACQSLENFLAYDPQQEVLVSQRNFFRRFIDEIKVSRELSLFSHFKEDLILREATRLLFSTLYRRMPSPEITCHFLESLAVRREDEKSLYVRSLRA